MEKLNKEIIGRIHELTDTIDTALGLLLRVNGKQNIKEYKYLDLLCLDKYIKTCARCGKQFIPNYNTRNIQIYCDINCRYEATSEKRYNYKLDKYHRPVDLLRKAIYERIYRANKLNKPIQNYDGLQEILKDLTALLKKRQLVTDEEYFKEFAQIKEQYNKLTHKTNKL